MALNLLLAALLCAVLCHGLYRERKAYRSIDRLLDCVLDREEIKDSELKEGEYSAFVSKMARIKEVLERQAENAEEEKEQVKRLISHISHQLKTPLANLSIYTELLTSQEAEGEKKQELSRKIQKQIEKLDWMIGSLSKMVKLEQNAIVFEVKDLPVKETILDAVDAVYGKAEKKGIEISLLPFSERILRHNRKWTAEVFVNLLENAVKYSAEGGAVQISAHPYEMYTEIRFVDHGPGIPKEELTQIFQRFYRGRAARQAEGCGIGLYLSNLILEKERGFLTVKSVYGAGSCFSVFLKNARAGVP